MPTGLGGLAAFVAALMVRGAYRYASSPRRGPDARRSLASFGTVLMLAGVIAGATAAGALIAERPDGEPLPLPAAWVTAAGVLVLGIGGGLRAGGTRERDIHVGATRGRAFVRSIAATGGEIKGVPVWEIDMDVTGPGIEPFHTVHLEAVPRGMAETIREGRSFPLLIEPGGLRRVALDWISAPPPADDGFADRPAPVVAAEPPAAPAVVAAPKVVMVVVTIVLLAVVLNVMSRLFDSDAHPVRVPPATSLDPTASAAL